MSRPMFGLNVSGSAAPGADPVSDARTAERLGFDFVSISDHPGSPHPCFETWTLLTWIAASTSRITVMPRVLGVPFRAPALVAKSAESLSRLAAGRLVLGLGAGYDDQEFARLGLPVRTTGQKISGLDDAVQIIRGMWQHSDFTYTGSIYHTGGADLEPKPARRIPIWLGTFGPRALKITGRLADGWIPSRGYVPDDQLPVMRQAVLDAAERHGRDPSHITCALNVTVHIVDRPRGLPDPFTGPPARIAEELLHYVELGFRAFNFAISGQHSKEQIERLAADVLAVIT
jgi:alkanesulfonate monooxygenase SsuD/methylene tetrahydromethanopterin reductase-like flavin-dependent oxidoreductase (luciferase family)